MRTIRVFLASSITEFARERVQLGDFVRTLNDILIQRGLYIRLEKSEDISGAVDPVRKQNQYNAVIRASDYFFMLVGKAVGSYTMEEYREACGAEKAVMRILFRQKKEEQAGVSAAGKAAALPDHGRRAFGASDAETVSDLPDAGAAMTQEAFRGIVEEETRAYQEFDNLDSAKLALLLMLTGEREIADCLLIRDGQALLDGKEALNLLDTPVYQKDPDLSGKIRRRQALQRETVRLLREEMAAGQASSGSQARRARMQEMEAELARLERELARQESDILRLFTYINKETACGVRERTARRYLAEGDLAAAAEILRDPLREAERATAEERIRRRREQACRRMQENRAEALTLLGGQIQALPRDREEMAYLAELLLAENARLAKEYLTGFPAIYDYILWKQCRGENREAARLAAALEDYYDLYGAEEEDKEALRQLQKTLYKKEK